MSRTNFLQPAELTYTNIMLLIVKSFLFQYFEGVLVWFSFAAAFLTERRHSAAGNAV